MPNILIAVGICIAGAAAMLPLRQKSPYLATLIITLTGAFAGASLATSFSAWEQERAVQCRLAQNINDAIAQVDAKIPTSGSVEIGGASLSFLHFVSTDKDAAGYLPSRMRLFFEDAQRKAVMGGDLGDLKEPLLEKLREAQILVQPSWPSSCT